MGTFLVLAFTYVALALLSNCAGFYRFLVSRTRLICIVEIMSQLKSQAKWIMNSKEDADSISQIASTLNKSLVSLLQNARSRDILPAKSTLIHAVQSLPAQLPSHGLGLSHTAQHLV
jgi:hypothetical protein